MSIEVMNWAWKLKLTATQKIVMVALADRANDDWECWPGQQSLADKCSLSDRCVRKVLSEVQEMGYLIIEHRHDGLQQKTNLYRLVHTPQPEHGSTPQPEHGSTPQPEHGSTPPRNMVPPLLKEEPSVEPSVCVPSKSSATKNPPEKIICFDVTVFQFRDISESQFMEWESLFKKIDVLAEIEKAEAWLKANPKKRKKNYDRFLLNWFSRAADRLSQRPTAFKPQTSATGR